MTSTALLLLLISAALHASWNLLSKRQHPTLSFFLLANTAGGAFLIPSLFAYRAVLPHLDETLLLLLALTGFFQATYYLGLARAYRAGEISVAYPLARSLPAILVAIIAFLLGRGDQISIQCLLGIGLVVAGCFLIPMRHFADLHLSNYLNDTCGFALIAACGTAGYSTVDDEALRLLRHTPALAAAGNTGLTLVYACLEAFASSLWLGLFIALRRPAHLSQSLRRDGPSALLAGLMIYLTYGMVLISMAFVADVSYVVAFRQLSIPLGALLGIAVLREPPHPPKLIGVGIALAGLMLVGTG